MEIKGIGHIALAVANLEASSRFYREVLGLQQIQYPFPLNIAFFTAGRTHHELALVELGPDAPKTGVGPKIGLHHIAFNIGDSTEELRAVKTRLELAGQDIVSLTDVYYIQSLTVRDPDGNEIELYVDINPAPWQNQTSDEVRIIFPQPMVLS